MFAKFLNDESGASAIEYVLLAALIGLAIIGGAGALGTAIDTELNDLATALTNNGV